MRQSTIKTFLFLSLLLVLLGSCKNLYVQKNVFVPLLKEKGELVVEGNMGRDNVALNSAYAFDKQFSVMINGFATTNDGGSYANKYNRQLETGLGYYKIFNDSFLHFESQLGVSRGWFNSSFDRNVNELVTLGNSLFILTPISPLPLYFPNPFLFLLLFFSNTERVDATGTYQTAFFQNSISLLSGNNSTTFTGRFQYVKFDKYVEEGIFNGQKIKYGIHIPSKIFFQPVLTNKIGLAKGLSATTQVGYNIEVNPDYSMGDAFSWNSFFLSVGLELRLKTNKR